MKLGKTWCLSIAVLFSFAAKANYSAKIYEAGSKRSKELFVLKVTFETLGAEEKAVAIYSDAGTKEVALAETSILKGDKFLRMDLDQKQLGAKATVEIRDGRVYFTKTVDGKTKSDDEAIKGDFVISANFHRYLKSKWTDILADKTVDFRYGVWDRLETVGFSVKKVAEEGSGDSKIVTIKMKASNFVIAALVNPLEVKLTSNGERLVAISGRVAPKQKKGDKFADLDAEMVYSYP